MKLNQLLILLIFVFTNIACNTKTKQDNNLSSDIKMIKERERLVSIHGCNDCHSPKKMTKLGRPIPDEKLLLSGHPMNQKFSQKDSSILKSREWILFNLNGTITIGPWGTSFAANLTPDETGIRNWTLEQFTRAIRDGKYKGLENGRRLLPPMPTVGYKKLKDEEIQAIFKYLKSIKPITNIVPNLIPLK